MPTDPPCEATAAGFGYGGRFELGPVRLGLAGHYGQGLGLNYALEVSDASIDPVGHLRKFDGYYAQSMLVLGKVDVSAGWGIARVFLNPADNVAVPDPTDATMTRRIIPHSVIKYQMGASGGRRLPLDALGSLRSRRLSGRGGLVSGREAGRVRLQHRHDVHLVAVESPWARPRSS